MLSFHSTRARAVLVCLRMKKKNLQIEHDCPAHLVPFHVKPEPDVTRITVDLLPAHAQAGEVWDQELCPTWCMAEEPVSQTPTESGPVDVRECAPGSGARW